MPLSDYPLPWHVGQMLSNFDSVIAPYHMVDINHRDWHGGVYSGDRLVGAKPVCSLEIRSAVGDEDAHRKAGEELMARAELIVQAVNNYNVKAGEEKTDAGQITV